MLYYPQKQQGSLEDKSRQTDKPQSPQSAQRKVRLGLSSARAYPEFSDRKVRRENLCERYASFGCFAVKKFKKAQGMTGCSMECATSIGVGTELFYKKKEKNQ